MLSIHSRRSTNQLPVASSTARARMDIATRDGSTSGLQGVSLPTGTSELHSRSSTGIGTPDTIGGNGLTGPEAPLPCWCQTPQTRACIGNTYHKQAYHRLAR